VNLGPALLLIRFKACPNIGLISKWYAWFRTVAN